MNRGSREFKLTVGLLVTGLLLLLCVTIVAAQDAAIVTLQPGSQQIQQPLQVYHDVSGEKDLATITQEQFKQLDTTAVLPAGKTVHWVRLVLDNNSPYQQERYLYAGGWSRLELYLQHPDGTIEKRQTGQLLPISARDLPQNKPYVRVKLAPNSQTLVYLRLQGDINLYKPQHLNLQLETPEQVVEANNSRLFVQGIFIGVIIVMALYNLVLYISVRDRSYLYYVMALTGTGLYFMFYHGFALELLWPAAPYWNAHSFAFIVTFNGIFRLLFTRSYLDTRQTMPVWDRVLTFLALLYAIPVAMGLLSYFTSIDLLKACVDLIGIIGGAVLVAMLLVGAISFYKGYRPALYFVFANLLFVVGSLLFILKEMQWLPDTPLTLYSAQVGIVAQVVLFSLGLAYRLNTVTTELANEVLEKKRLELEKEVERKHLIEQQKKELEVTVANRTAALRSKTQELKHTVRQLKASELKLMRINSIKDRFFSIISHDLRTPLATLDSFLNILLNFSDRMKPEQMQKLANHTQLSVRNLQALLENLLQWSAAQTGSGDTVTFEPETIVLHQNIETNLALLQDTAAAKNISWQATTADNLKVYADANMLSFVIRNLLHNAIKFSEPGKTIKLHACITNSNMAEITIEDEGIGMNAETVASLFSQEQLAQTTKGTANEKGTGLGLLLCRLFVERNGGFIWVKSEPGKGSRFWFTVPLAPSGQPQKQQAATSLSAV